MLGKLSIKAMLGFAVPYGFVLASLYLYAYWHPVGLQPFQYANAADLVSATIGTIVTWLAALIVMIAITYLIDYVSPNKTPSNPNKAAIVIACIAIIFAAIASWLGNSPIKWMITAFAVGTISMLILRKSEWVDKHLPTRPTRLAAIIITIVLPAIFYGRGTDYVNDALIPARGGVIVDAKRSDIGVPTNGRVMYLGMLGNFHVLRELSTRTTIILPSDKRIVFQQPIVITVPANNAATPKPVDAKKNP